MRVNAQQSLLRRFWKVGFSLLLLPGQITLAQEVEQEEMICRDMGDIFCSLDDFSKNLTPPTSAVNSMAAKIGPEPGDKKTRLERSVLDLQKDMLENAIEVGGDGPKLVEFFNLNPAVNAWYLVKLTWNNQKSEWYHIENPNPEIQFVNLDSKFPKGLWISDGKSEGHGCELWAQPKNPLFAARGANSPYAPVCNKELYVRNKIDGFRTTKEWVVEFLRSNVVGGETITNIVKETVYKDNFLIKSESAARGQGVQDLPDGPEPARISEKYKGELLAAQEMGIAVTERPREGMEAGRWYRSERQQGVFVSAIEPRAIAEDILKSNKDYVRGLDDVEMGAVSYLVAFDLGYFDLSFAIGTDHPAVGWSERVLPEAKDPLLKGPDGFQTVAPVVTTGLIPPFLADRVAGIFTGGFKRDHGAFRWGELSRKNRGSHYGFVENGVVLSTLQPELSTLAVYKDGSIAFKTWEEGDNLNISNVRFARQNGMPIIEWDAVQKKGVPGRYVSNWTLGNWSGSQDRKFRTLRAGLCESTRGARKFLIYGYFSSMTPTAMARVFQAYGCNYAMHLDMNALEHTYMALYSQDKNEQRVPQHLVRGMRVLDERFKGNVPRYIGYPDNRDFFYFTEKHRAAAP